MLAVEVDGELVVDLWVGRTPEASLIHTFSKVKPLTACALLLAHDDGTDANLIAALGIIVNLAEGDLNGALSIAATMTEPVESTQAIGLPAVHTWAGQFEQAQRYIAIARELEASEPSDYAIAVAPGFAAVLGIESADPPTIFCGSSSELGCR